MLQICLDLGWQLDWFDMLFCLIGQGYVEAGFVCVLCARVCARISWVPTGPPASSSLLPAGHNLRHANETGMWRQGTHR